MKKHSGSGPLKANGLSKFYILTRPSKLSDLTLDELGDEDMASWRDKSRQLQARRWRKLKHQMM